MLTDEEIMEIRNRAKLNDNRQIDPLPFAREIERAVMENVAGNQEPVGSVKKWIDSNTAIVSGDRMSEIYGEEKLYFAPQPEQAAIPDGYCLAPNEPTESMLDAGVAMALQVSVHGEGGWSKYLTGLYKQMLSASPKPE